MSSGSASVPGSRTKVKAVSHDKVWEFGGRPWPLLKQAAVVVKRPQEMM